MRKGVQTGLAGTDYEDRILGWQSGRYAELERQGKLLGDGLTHRMTSYVTALMEAKSAMEGDRRRPNCWILRNVPRCLVGCNR